jgi:hypothetical protein
MLKELDKHPDCGCLGYTNGLGVIVQYWKSFDALETYARSALLPATGARDSARERLGGKGTA